MSKERNLLERRAKVLESVKDLRRQMSAEGFEWSPEFEAKYEKIMKDQDVLEKEIQLEQKSKELEKKAIEKAEVRAETEARKGDTSYAKVFDKYTRRGISGLDNDERSVLMGNHTSVEKRGTSTLITTTDSLGGYLIPDEWSNELVKAMLYYGPMLEAGNVFTTSGGGTFHIPFVNDTATAAAKQATEDTAITVQDFTFSEVTLDAYTYASLVLASYQQMRDEEYNLAGFITSQLGERIGRKLNTELTVGDGTGDANGVVTATSAGKTAAATNAITRSEIIDFIHSVDRAYRQSPSCGFMMHDLILAEIKKLTVGSADDRPLWQPSIREGEPDRLEGFRYWVNNDMASSMAANAKTLLFGDFSKYYIRRVGGINLQRLNERYAERLSVGFLGWVRADGDLVDTNAIKHLIQAAV